MSNGIINWHEEKADGQFIAKSAKPQKLDWWAKKVKEGRQLTHSIPDIENKLYTFNNQNIIKGNKKANSIRCSSASIRTLISTCI